MKSKIGRETILVMLNLWTVEFSVGSTIAHVIGALDVACTVFCHKAT